MAFFYNFECPNCLSHYNIEIDRFMCRCGTVFKRNDVISDDAVVIPTFLMYYTELLATIAKINGDVSEDVVREFERVLKESDVSVEDVYRCVLQFRQHPDRTYEKTMLFMLQRFLYDDGFKGFVLYGCLRLAHFGSKPTRRQFEVIEDVRILFNISDALYAEVLDELSHEHEVEDVFHDLIERKDEELLQALQMLGLDEGVNKHDAKVAYRTLMKQYHPDRIECANLPKDIKAYMTQRAIQIKIAYETLQKKGVLID